MNEVLQNLPHVCGQLSRAWVFVALLMSSPVATRSQDFTYTTNSPDTNTVTITGYTGSGGAVEIPSNILGKAVTRLGNSSFEFCGSLTSIIIPDSVTIIGASAFHGCSNLANAVIGNGVTDIYGMAFVGCVLTNAVIGDSVTNIGEIAFFDCFRDANLVIGDGITNIGYPLIDFGNVANLILGKGFTKIQDGAFYEGCGMTNIVLPDSVTNIGALAFAGCGNLTSIIIPDSVTRFEGQAFSYSSLTSITIPYSVTSMGNLVFDRCHSLTGITVNVGNTAFSSRDGVLFNQSQTALITYPNGKTGSYSIPDGVTRIGYSAFHSCANLTGITIPNSVTDIEDAAFGYCTSLTSITVPDSVTNTGSGAFYECMGLNDLYFCGNAPVTGSSTFEATPNVTIYYLLGTTGWPPVPDLWEGRPTALWLPKVLDDGNLGVQAGQFGFSAGWADGKTVVVEATTNLTASNWVSVATKTPTNGTFYFSDVDWGEYSNRFYRLRPTDTTIRHQPLIYDLPIEGYLDIDINNDYVKDLYFYSGRYPSGNMIVQIVQIGGAILLTTPLSSGMMIDSNLAWRSDLHGEMFDFAIRTTVDTPFENGPWAGITNAYLPVSFMNATNRYYGWIRLEGYQYAPEENPNAIFWNLRLRESAYETIPNKGILAGQTE